MCHSCIVALFENQKKKKEIQKGIICPTCGPSSGSLKIKKIEDIKINKELAKFIQNYHQESKAWKKEKRIMEAEILQSKGQKNSESDKENSIDRKDKVNELQNLSRDALNGKDIYNKGQNNDEKITIKLESKSKEESIQEGVTKEKDQSFSLQDKDEEKRKKGNLKRKALNQDHLEDNEILFLKKKKY